MGLCGNRGNRMSEARVGEVTMQAEVCNMGVRVTIKIPR